MSFQSGGGRGAGGASEAARLCVWAGQQLVHLTEGQHEEPDTQSLWKPSQQRPWPTGLKTHAVTEIQCFLGVFILAPIRKQITVSETLRTTWMCYVLIVAYKRLKKGRREERKVQIHFSWVQVKFVQCKNRCFHFLSRCFSWIFES